MGGAWALFYSWFCTRNESFTHTVPLTHAQEMSPTLLQRWCPFLDLRGLLWFMIIWGFCHLLEENIRTDMQKLSLNDGFNSFLALLC